MSIVQRRQFVLGTLAGLLGIGTRQNALAKAAKQNAPAKRCLMLWMNGGPTQLETFDPKPGTNTGGPTQAINTNVPGMQFAEHLPQLAKHADDLSVIRNVTSEEGEHERAQYYLHTGFRLVPAFPRPALGSVISHEHPLGDLPSYVLLGDRQFGPAYCGPDHSSFVVQDARAASELLGTLRKRQADLEFLKLLNQDFDSRNQVPALKQRQAMLSRVERLTTTSFRNTLNPERESGATRQRYGEHAFGERCLIARRLLEQGVPFVEVQLNGWDTHVNNFREITNLTSPLDQAWSALMTDLKTSGLWEDTLIVWMGEFGRTPLINGQNGRDHFPAVTPVVFAGGCVNTGQTIGATNRTGQEIAGSSYRIADVAATILSCLGIAPDQEFFTDFDSPTTATDKGQVIQELLS